MKARTRLKKLKKMNYVIEMIKFFRENHLLIMSYVCFVFALIIIWNNILLLRIFGIFIVFILSINNAYIIEKRKQNPDNSDKEENDKN